MTIRRAALEDLDALIDVYVRGWQTAYADLVDTDFLADMGGNPRSRDYLQNLLSSDRNNAVVLLDEDNGRINGFIAGGHSRDVFDPELAEIYAIYIDPDAQRQGSGRALFDACSDALRQSGFTRLHVWTFAANTQAQNAYTRWGAVETGANRMVTVGGDMLEEVGFDWRL